MITVELFGGPMDGAQYPLPSSRPIETIFVTPKRAAGTKHGPMPADEAYHRDYSNPLRYIWDGPV